MLCFVILTLSIPELILNIFYGRFHEGYLSWVSGVADNSLYPILLLDCFLQLMGTWEWADNDFGFLEEGPWRLVVVMTLTFGLTYLNYRGLDVVGKVAVFLCIFTMLPFVVFCLLGVGQVQPERWAVQPPDGWRGINWRLYLNTFFWNINYWDSAACFAGDVKNPGYTYPRGLFLAFAFVTLSAFLPVLVGLGASSKPYTEWTDGYFTALAVEIGGPWLGIWMLAAATVCNIGCFEAEMSTDSWQIAGMADRGILPTAMGHRSKYDTPTCGILMSACGVFCLCWMSFSEVIDMLNVLYCIAQLVEFAAFVQLRIKHPDMPRPYRIPLGTVGVSLMLLIPALFCVLIISLSSKATLLVITAITLFGFVLQGFLHIARERGWFEFHNIYSDSALLRQTQAFHQYESIPTLELPPPRLA
jgi:amino acid transporter